MKSLSNDIELAKSVESLLVVLDPLQFSKALVTAFSDIADPAVDKARSL